MDEGGSVAFSINQLVNKLMLAHRSKDLYFEGDEKTNTSDEELQAMGIKPKDGMSAICFDTDNYRMWFCWRAAGDWYHYEIWAD